MIKFQKKCLFLIIMISILMVKNADAAFQMASSSTDPFQTVEGGFSTLIEKVVGLTKWIASGALIIYIIVGMIGRFDKGPFIKIALGLAAISGVGWAVDLFMAG